MATDVKTLVQAEFKKLDEQVTEVNNRITEEVAAFGKIGEGNKQALDTLNKTVEETMARVLELEQGSGGSGEGTDAILSCGQQFVESDAFKAFVDGSQPKAKFEITNNTITGSDTTVAPDRREGVVPGATRRLRVEEVLPTIPTTSNAIEYVKELAFTNNAAEQNGEGAALAESAITFDLVNLPVRTIGHFIRLSKQMIADGPSIAGYVNVRLAYGVDLKVDTQLVSGDGTNNTLSGLLDAGNFTAFSATSGDNELQSLRKAITQLELADYYPTAILLNPSEVQNIDLLQGTDEHFVAADPRMMNVPRAWGLPIVSTNAVAAGSFVMGAFDMATILHARRGTTIEMSESDEDNFQKELVTVKATRRCALEVNTPAAIVGGTLTVA